MATTPNTGVTHVEASQNNKHVTVNEALDVFDEQINDTVDVTIGGSPTDITLTDDQLNRNQRVHLVGTPGENFTVNVPANKRSFLIDNDTDGTATIKTTVADGSPTGATVAVVAGANQRCYSDATSVMAEAGPAVPGQGVHVAAGDNGDIGAVSWETSGDNVTLLTLTKQDVAKYSSEFTPMLKLQGGVSADNVGIRYENNGIHSFLGIDQLNHFKLTVDVTSGQEVAFDIDNDGRMILPSCPSFLVTLSGSVNNVTGNGTVYTVVWNSEIIDRGNDFNTSTGVFTAPVTGLYQLGFSLFINNVDAEAHDACEAVIVTSNRSYNIEDLNVSGIDTLGAVALGGSIMCDMDINDTAFVTLMVSGGTSPGEIDLFNISATNHFWGRLVA